MLPRRYRELYRAEGGKQAEISGYHLHLQGKPAGGARYGWTVETDISGQHTHADVTFLLWSDIVSTSMERSIFGTYLLLFETAWRYIRSGVLWRLMKLQKGPVIAALYPIIMLLVQLALAVLVWGGISSLLAHYLHPLVGIALGAVAFGLLMRWFKKKDGKFFVYYLMHDYAFSAKYDGAHPPQLEARMTEFRHEIEAALDGDVDEVLIVGHSSGAHLGVSILADLLAERPLSAKDPKLGFLTLGQVIPMVSFLPGAWKLRKDLNALSTEQSLTWVDVTAPGDGCTFALCDPVSVSGADPDQGTKIWPLVFSAAYRESLSKDLFDSLKWRFFRLHFQYLCAFDRPRDYDYFQITAGPVSLSERFKDRPPSRSRIETPVSPFQSMVAPE